MKRHGRHIQNFMSVGQRKKPVSPTETGDTVGGSMKVGTALDL